MFSYIEEHEWDWKQDDCDWDWYQNGEVFAEVVVPRPKEVLEGIYVELQSRFEQESYVIVPIEAHHHSFKR